jgi:hypothetical protein
MKHLQRIKIKDKFLVTSSKVIDIMAPVFFLKYMYM